MRDHPCPDDDGLLIGCRGHGNILYTPTTYTNAYPYIRGTHTDNDAEWVG